MAFTRNWLKTMGLSDEQVQTIMEEHTNVTDALKAQRDKFDNDAKALKVEADKVPGLLQQIQDAQNGEDFKGKYEKEHQAFEDYKKDIANKEKVARVEKAYRQLLTDEKISDKRHDAIVRVTDLTKMELGDDGKLKNLDDLKKSIAEDWGEFKVTTKQKVQNVPTPPENDKGNGGDSRARDIYMKHLEQRGIKIDAGKE